jgi:hypothetical protein
VSRVPDAIRRLLVGDEVEIARHWQAATSTERAELHRFEKNMAVRSDTGRVILGRARSSDGGWFWVGLPTEEFLSIHSWATGSTGSGKTYEVLGVLLQLLRQKKNPLVVLDLKGELAALLVDTILPALATGESREELLGTLRVVRPFDSDFVPQLRLTAPERGVGHEIQALNLAAALEESLGADLGARMSYVFLRLASLAVELNRPLPRVADWLRSPEAFAREARQSGDQALREYARMTFPRENRASLDALRARLDSFLFLPQVRAALSTPECLNLSEALDRGVTIIDLGDPPAGAEGAARFWAGVLIGRLTRAILSRPVREDSPLVLVVLEEFQEALQRFQADQFGRLLALARHKRVSLFFVNQQPGQLGPDLTRLLRTNTGLEMAFRCSLDDARLFAQALPVAEEMPNRAEARLQLAREMTQLPRRTYCMWLKEASFRAQLVRSPRLELPQLRELAAKAPEEVRRKIRQGTAAIPRADFEVSSAQARAYETAESEVDTNLPSGPARPEAHDPFPGLG